MDSLNVARQLADAGRLTESLKVLNGARIDRNEKVEADALKAELLERTGRMDLSRSLVEALLKSRDLTRRHRGTCEYVLGRMAWAEGDTNTALMHFQRSISWAGQEDLERTCWCQIQLSLILSDRSGPDAVSPMLAELRSNATRLGEPHLVAALSPFRRPDGGEARVVAKCTATHAIRSAASLSVATFLALCNGGKHTTSCFDYAFRL